MTTQEMHIGLDMDLQILNSYANKDILPQEKDWFLNQEVNKFINQRMSPESNIKRTGFQDTTKRIKDLKDFIKVGHKLPVLTNNEGERYIYLPPDYYEHIRATAKVAKNCGQELQRTNTTYYRVAFNLRLPNTVNLDSYIIILDTPSGNHTVFNITSLPSGYLINNEFRKQKFMLIKALQIKLKDNIKAITPNFSLYWENEGYEFLPETYILHTTTPITGIRIIINGSEYYANAETYQVPTYSNEDLLLTGKIRLIDEEFKTDVDKSYLSKSRGNSLTSTIRNHVMVIDIPNSVILGNVELAYICKPNLIDLHLNSNLNANRKVCEEIVSNTARVIKGLIQDNNYEQYVRENMLIE